MDNPIRPQSRLLLRLALALEENKVPFPAPGRRHRGRGGPDERQARTEEPECAGEDGCAEKPSGILPDSAWQRLETLSDRFEAELLHADEYLVEDHPSSRIKMLLASSSELRKVAILQRFVERAYSLRLHRPEEGLKVADDVIEWTKADPSPLVAVIRCRALLERGNFLRILGDPEGAHAALAEAAKEIDADGSGDRLELARYQELLGTLKADCGEYDAAARLLRRSLSKVRRWGDNHTLQRVLNATGMMEIACNNYRQAETLLDEAMRKDEPDSIFMQYAASNRVLAYFRCGNPHKAYQALLRIRANLGTSWRRGIPERTRMRQEWVEGQILNALRLDEEAIGILRQAREFSIRSALGYEVCGISIDLAMNYAAQNEFAKVGRELALGLSFCSEGSPRDNYAKEGVLLLQGALQRQGLLEVDQIRAVVRQLDRVQRAPLRAQRPPVQLQL